MSNPVKKHFTYTVKDFHKRYKEFKVQEGVNKNDVIPYKNYKLIIEQMFLEINKDIIYNQLIWVLPYSLGRHFIKAKKNANIKKSRTAIDFHLTKKLGKVVRHMNTHTFGYYFQFYWDKTYSRFRNRAYYIFTATKSKKATRNGVGKLALSKHIRELSEDPLRRSYIRI